MSYVKIRRSMTQSEKHRRFVEKYSPYSSDLGSRSSSRYRGAQIVDCPQNVVELRKLLQACQHLERGRKKAISKINREKQSLRKSYRRSLSIQELLKEGSSFDLPPGFRYKKNGDLKSSDARETARENTAAVIEKKLSQLYIRRHNSTVFTEQLSPGGDASVAKKKLSRTDINKEIASIEKELRELKQSGYISDINSKISAVRDKISHVKLSIVASEGKQKDTANRRRAESSGKVSHSNSRAINKPEDKFSADRFSKKYSRVNCTACEARIKQSNSDVIKPENSSFKKPVRRWMAAPSGMYVNKPGSISIRKSQSGKKTTTNSVSKTPHGKMLSEEKISKPENKAISLLKQNTKVMDVTQSNPEIKVQNCGDRHWRNRSFVCTTSRDAETQKNGKKTRNRDVYKRASSPDATGQTNRQSLLPRRTPSKPNNCRGDNERPKRFSRESCMEQDLGISCEKYTEEQFRYVMQKSRISNKNNLATLDELHKDRGEQIRSNVRGQSKYQAKESTSSLKVDSSTDSRYSKSSFDFRKSLAQLEAERAISKIRMKNRAEVEQDVANSKVNEFLSILPKPSTTIARWRNSHGQLVNDKTAKAASIGGNSIEKTESLTWAEYRKSQDDLEDLNATYCIQPDATSVFLQQQQEAYDKLMTYEPESSQNELAMCRYLRLMPHQEPEPFA